MSQEGMVYDGGVEHLCDIKEPENGPCPARFLGNIGGGGLGALCKDP